MLIFSGGFDDENILAVSVYCISSLRRDSWDAKSLFFCIIRGILESVSLSFRFRENYLKSFYIFALEEHESFHDICEILRGDVCQWVSFHF